MLWRLMIDERYQGRGYAKEILDEVVRLVKTEPCGKYHCLLVSYEKENTRGRDVYLKYGFKETELFCGDEIVAIYE
ncbi:MAG: GNAT family N-acetyltransferase [Erysipelotrichaceae bacterium]|nr:GNAT family N-acetyltransferase [Erysipelotrichaceae bacterium]